MVKEPSIKIEGLRKITYKDIQKIFETGDSRSIEKLRNPEILHFLEQIGKLDDREFKVKDSGKGIIHTNIPPYLAYQIYEGSFPPHNAYWNDRFYIAQKFNLDEFHKKISTIVLLWNGDNDYFEWITHDGFDNARLFRELNLINPQEENLFRESYKKQGILYTSLTRNLSEKVADKFQITKEERKYAHLISQTVGEKMGIYHL